MAASRYTSPERSLIVLPEAFNLGREYDPNARPKAAPLLDERVVLQQLRTLAETHHAAFVVGIIETTTRRNVAYLVDGQIPRLICEKFTDDGSQEYQPGAEVCAGENPLDYCGVGLAALVCADVIDNRSGGQILGAKVAYERRQEVFSKLLTASTRVLAVPAYMNMSLQEPRADGIGLVLANARPHNDSIIKSHTGTVISRPKEVSENEVCLVEVSRLRDDTPISPQEESA